MFKKVLLLTSAIIVAAGLGVLLPYLTSDQSIGVQVDELALQEQFKIEVAKQMALKIAEIEEEAVASEAALRDRYEEMWDAFVEDNPGAVESYMGHLNGDDQDTSIVVEAAEVVDKVKSTTNVEGEVSTATIESTESTVESAGVASSDDEIDLYEIESVPAGSEDTIVSEAVVKDTWVNQKISENRDEISDADLYSGAEIYNQLDTVYLFGLAADGLTKEEEEEAKTYLRASLSESEIAVVMELYGKYVHLLE